MPGHDDEADEEQADGNHLKRVFEMRQKEKLGQSPEGADARDGQQQCPDPRRHVDSVVRTGPTWSRLIANRDRRGQDAADQPAFIDQWPPVVEQDLEWAPHRDPSRDDEPLAKNVSQMPRRQ